MEDAIKKITALSSTGWNAFGSLVDPDIREMNKVTGAIAAPALGMPMGMQQIGNAGSQPQQVQPENYNTALQKRQQRMRQDVYRSV